MANLNLSRARNLWHTLLDLRRQLETERGVLAFFWCLRTAMLIASTWYFYSTWDGYVPAIRPLIKTALGIFCVYAALAGIGGYLRWESFLTRKVKFLQVVFEIALYSLLYRLSGDPRTGIFYMYFVPLFVAARYLGLLGEIAVLAFASACLGIALYSFPGGFGVFSGMEEFVFREFVIVSLPLLYALGRRPTVIEDVQEAKSQLMSILKTLDEGMYVVDRQQGLLFVNEVLQEKHGPYKPGQSCATYFLCQDQLCGWCPPITHLTNYNTVATRQEGVFIDRRGHPYQIEVSSYPLPDADLSVIGAIAFVRDVSEQKRREREIAAQLHGYIQRTQALTIEKSKLLQAKTKLWRTCYEMGQRLAGMAELPELVEFVVQETCKQLGAESSALFLLDDNRLKRIAIWPQRGWFPDESYGVGEGITGRAVLPTNTEKHARPQRVNDVDSNPLAIQSNLVRYQAILDTHVVRHLIAVPLNGQDDSFGVLRVVNKLDAPGRINSAGFQEEDEEFLVTLAAMVAVAVENARLLEQSEQRFQELTTLYAVGKKITQPLDQQELFQTIVDEARKTIRGADRAVIHRQDNSGALVPEAVSGDGIGSLNYPLIRADEGIVGQALYKHQAIYVPDTETCADFVPRQTSLRSLLVAPLIVDKETLGSISIVGQQPNAFRPDDERLLVGLAAHAVAAMEKARLYRSAQDERRIANTLRDIARAVNASLDSPQLLMEHILTEMLKVVEYDSTSIQLLSNDRDQLQIIACRGFDNPESVRKVVFPANDPKFPNYTVIKTCQPYRVPDVRSQYPHFIEEADQYYSGHIRSWMGIPLIYKGNVIGMISLEKTSPEYFTDANAKLALTFADHVANAIENSRLYEKTRHQVDELERLHHASQALLAASLHLNQLYKKIPAIAADLVKADDAGLVLIGEDGTPITKIPTTSRKHIHSQARPTGITTEIVRTQKPRVFDDVIDDGITHNPLIFRRGVRSYIGMPIMSRGEVYAVLYVRNFRPYKFSQPGTLTILKTFCNTAAMAIENARLYKKRGEEARREAREIISDDLHALMNTLHGAVVLKTAYASALMDKQDYTAVREQLHLLAKAVRHVHKGLGQMYADVRMAPLRRGLMSALRNYTKLLRPRVRFSSHGEAHLPSDVEYALYRIAQEALTNVSRHSKIHRRGGRAYVELQTDAEGFRLIVNDDGVGFDVPETLARNDSFGLRSMNHWAQLIGAQFSISPREHGGTCIQVTGSLQKERKYAKQD